MTLAAFAAVALSAQAATITWGLGADVYLMKDGDSYDAAVLATDASFAPADGSYLALVYVGQGVDSFNIANITAASVVASAPYAIDTSMGGVDYNPFTTDTDTTAYEDGASFGVVWFDAGAPGGGKFRNILSIDDGSAFNNTVTIPDMVRGSAGISPAETTNGWGGVLTVTVPEPGIACMALLGIGMMLKRRRA